MGPEQNKTQVITHEAIEAMKATTMAAREENNPVHNTRLVHVTTRLGGPTL